MKILNFVCLIFLIQQLAYSQFNEAKYGVSKVETIFKSKESSQKDFLKTVEEEIGKNLPHFIFTLKYSREEAIFEIEKVMMGELERGKKLAYIMVQGDNKYYYNQKSDSIIMQTEAYGETFRVFSNISTIEWNFSEESKSIDGFICYKATTTYQTINEAGTFRKIVTAWYAPKIPSPFGPLGYAGLPGLILELQDDKILYYLKEINFNKKGKIEKIKRGKIVTKEQLDNYAYDNAIFRN